MGDRLTPRFPIAGSGACSLPPAGSVTARSSVSLCPPASVGQASIAPSFRFPGCQESAQPATFTEESLLYPWCAGGHPKAPSPHAAAAGPSTQTGAAPAFPRCSHSQLPGLGTAPLPEGPRRTSLVVSRPVLGHPAPTLTPGSPGRLSYYPR